MLSYRRNYLIMGRLRNITCLCMRCGIRNDHSHPNGFCANGHDVWLEFKDIQERNEFFEETRLRAGMTVKDFIQQFIHKDNLPFVLHWNAMEEADKIVESGKPFDWSNIEINEWELGKRMIRADGNCICTMCNKAYKNHPLETRTPGEPYLHQICYGIWAKL